MQPAIESAEQARKAADDAAAAKNVAEEQARIARRKLWPVSIFVSRRTGRLYVRQGFEPVMELPVSLRDTDKPIGTHVFTAGNAGDTLVWQAVSLEGSSTGRSRPERTNPDTTEAVAALDRIRFLGKSPTSFQNPFCRARRSSFRMKVPIRRQGRQPTSSS